jgi:hypothetical protein
VKASRRPVAPGTLHATRHAGLRGVFRPGATFNYTHDICFFKPAFLCMRAPGMKKRITGEFAHPGGCGDCRKAGQRVFSPCRRNKRFVRPVLRHGSREYPRRTAGEECPGQGVRYDGFECTAGQRPGNPRGR